MKNLSRKSFTNRGRPLTLANDGADDPDMLELAVPLEVASCAARLAAFLLRDFALRLVPIPCPAWPDANAFAAPLGASKSSLEFLLTPFDSAIPCLAMNALTLARVPSN